MMQQLTILLFLVCLASCGTSSTQESDVTRHDDIPAHKIQNFRVKRRLSVTPIEEQEYVSFGQKELLAAKSARAGRTLVGVLPADAADLRVSVAVITMRQGLSEGIVRNLVNELTMDPDVYSVQKTRRGLLLLVNYQTSRELMSEIYRDRSYNGIRTIRLANELATWGSTKKRTTPTPVNIFTSSRKARVHKVALRKIEGALRYERHVTGKYRP